MCCLPGIMTGFFSVTSNSDFINRPPTRKIPSWSKTGFSFASEFFLLRARFSLILLISSRKASLRSARMMCFSVSRYRSTSFALLQKCHPLHGSVPLQHLATCFKRAMPETKLLQVEYLVNLSVPMEGYLICNVLTVIVGLISMSLSESTRSYSCAPVRRDEMYLLCLDLYFEGTIVSDHKAMGLFFIFSTAIGLVA